MNGWLVVLSHTMDDLPVRLCATREEALIYAKKLNPMPSKRLCKVFQTDCSTPVAVEVVEFKDGVPVLAFMVKGFD